MEKPTTYETTGAASADRSERPLMGPWLAFDLPAEAEALRREEPWKEHAHNARTLIKHSEYRLVLIVLGQGIHIDEQTVEERVALQTLRGELEFKVPTGLVELGAGGLITLDRNVPFGIRAIEPSELLLWVGWSRD